MKPTLQLRLGQSLTLTPQLRQAIRLLQLSSMELELEINQALESNPLLERPEDSDYEAEAERNDDSQNEPEPVEHSESEEFEASETQYEDLAPDWELSPGGSGSGSGEDGERPELGSPETETLHDHLLWQLNLTPMNERDRQIAVTLIDAIDDDGYLRAELAELIEAISPAFKANEAEIETVRHRLQHFDPIGVASRTLAECLQVQLNALPTDTDGRALALRLAHEALETLAKLGPERLAESWKVESQAMSVAVDLLRSLDPRPGAQVAPTSVEYVVPDAFAFRHQGRWEVRLGPGSTPRLGINRHYQGLIASASRQDANYMRGQLQEAKWLIRSLETRADTLLKVAGCIVRHQAGFLDRGPEAMRPLVLREVAEEVGLHESTVSRVTTRKYLHTPRGTFEFKHFFSSGVPTSDGGAASSTAIQAMIRRLVDAEDPRSPLSDAKLTTELKAMGVTVARRTVAKYREAMNIPASNERQRIG
ncbi:RNA polymerase factor sigma-54 [Pseudomarimonas arenosa]|uniref:RNA polymerase sigma-54 factor n=1 Tax=Pseudomarimonas arenosa TaxID=2774145 RepID=A0AAW3ZSH5_9GAMM|nr:RNA polymerase factor sigma-54 [Pseudomarimonas arenosa]MBD8527166.1 RNA polymerase factor sigma-54 [Pseudomarimonas arenosa]